ncbi:MAG: type II toxin-antitoxin system Phd/YefM family antitoxin [Tenacibaculum sp.]|nr:type II toxin-antitoxin system Phd/YefM family antitoxin [Tenacibaculum sp.]
MEVISTREFRAQQGKYLEMVNKGISVILKSRDKGSFKIVPVEKDDTLMSEEEFFAKLDKSMQQIKEGKSKTFTSAQELQNYMDNL